MKNNGEIVRAIAPLRISFGGGGTELSPYMDHFGGMTLSSTIDSYSMVTISKGESIDVINFKSDDIVVSASINVREIQDISLSELPDGVKIGAATLRTLSSELGLKVDDGFDFYSNTETPVGSGLGASSVLSVASIKAYDEFYDLHLTKNQIARYAFQAERQLLGLEGGRQDHFAAAYGGLNFIEYQTNGSTLVEGLNLEPKNLLELQSSMLMIYTGTSRKSASIIEKQIASMKANDNQTIEALHKMKSLAWDMRKSILNGDVRTLGIKLDESWNLKKITSESVSSKVIDDIYTRGLEAGAFGGKILGAGGGGFLLLIVPPHRRHSIARSVMGENSFVMQARFTNRGATSWRTREL